MTKQEQLHQPEHYDLIITHGLVFSGDDEPPQKACVHIRDGRVSKISRIQHGTANHVIDASGSWVTPGFIDSHTHYDAEALISPGLTESVRHGITTVFIGSCSISMILNDPEDTADMFTRVEAVPREAVLPVLQKQKSWRSVEAYTRFYDQHPTGPNIASYLGHSDLRAAVMGLGRATTQDEVPTDAELNQMSDLLESALDHGLLGLSTMTTKWDKIDGDRYRSASLPSTYAHWKEFRALNRVLRERGRVHQGAPNIVTKWNTVLFMFESMGLMRKRLKTTLITLMDSKANPGLVSLISSTTRQLNRFFNADFRWQALPNTFEVYADGMDLVVFEEFGSGEAALHLKTEIERNELLADLNYRRQFRKDYEKKWGGRVWHRDFGDALISACPDETLVGRSFGSIALQRDLHPADLFLDLVILYGSKLRWHTVIANHRPHVVEQIVQSPDVIISFSDAGAHLRNMAFYNFGLRLLQIAAVQKPRKLSVHRAVHRLTGELADWFNLDVGHLREGARADIAIVDPQKLHQPLDGYAEAQFDGIDSLQRMVNRPDDCVTHTIINGNIAYEAGRFAGDFGKARNYGCFLRAGEVAPAGYSATVPTNDENDLEVPRVRATEKAAL
ncbi:MAG: N-acyl-D-glutamate amidohydrolase [unclassified Hahellaceae]|nr:N-acyl-D-glutamate amidohydrolase [Hahellaceae bacterium]|tara:strand:- start:1475 stop:3328 length:1854 start_codon:yes stop_codon:yes gene_type:complete